MTQLQAARQGIVTEAMRAVAAEERLTPEAVRDAVASGRAVIPLNPAHKGVKPTGVGRLFSTKINANLGRSPTRSGKGDELTKLQVALDAGAQFVMDLSVGTGKGADEIRAELRDIRQGMLEHSPAPLGTVPIYETISRLDGDIPVMDPAYLLQVIREQAEQGVDFMTLHAGLLSRHLPLADSRKMGIVSRGGAIMAEWMRSHGAENPLYTHWDEVMDILAEHDVTVSLGDGLRPGCLADASDEAQFAELSVLGELVRRCRERGVQAMVEGPGHIPFDQIQMNMEREQELCDGAPFYVLGPVVTDIAPAYDHIVSAIGATAAATYGASLLCYRHPRRAPWPPRRRRGPPRLRRLPHRRPRRRRRPRPPRRPRPRRPHGPGPLRLRLERPVRPRPRPLRRPRTLAAHPRRERRRRQRRSLLHVRQGLLRPPHHQAHAPRPLSAARPHPTAPEARGRFFLPCGGADGRARRGQETVCSFARGRGFGKMAGERIETMNELNEKIRAKLEELRGMLQADGGDMELIDIEGKTVHLRLRGACGCCPHATMTIKDGIQRILREEIDPEIEVERVM